MTAFAIEPVISKQMNGRQFSLEKFSAGTVLEIRTLHHTYTLIIRHSGDQEVILVGNDREHATPGIYTFDFSFSEAEEFSIIPGVVREGFQLEFHRYNGVTFQTSYVDSVQMKRWTLRTWILRKSFEEDFLASVCRKIVSRHSRFFWGAAILYKNTASQFDAPKIDN